jgi:excisionase family DNA binding protein
MPANKSPDVTSLKLAISREQAATALSVDVQTIDRMIAANKLRASKLGRRVVIRVADIERMLDANSS